jgi:fatty-acyl-CoA synthase
MGGLHDVATLPELTVTALRRWPGREAFRQDGRAISYRGTADLLARYAAVLRERGLRRGEGVGLLSPNRPEAWLAQTAPLFAGGRYTALHPLGSFEDHRYACEEAELRILVVDPAYETRAGELLAGCAAVEQVLTLGPSRVGEDLCSLAESYGAVPLEAGPHTPDDIGWVLYTGGTTGVPKAAELTEFALCHVVFHTSHEWDLPLHRRYLVCAPITHAAGLPVLPTLLSGGTVILQRGFDPGRWLAEAESERATLGLLVPTMIYAVLDHPDLSRRDLAALETVMYGASAMSPARLAEGIERLGPIFAQFYGQTEAGGVVTCFARADHDPKDLRRLASCGRAFAGMRIALLDDRGEPVAPGEPGELCTQGPTVMRGYFKRPDLTAEALAGGWLHTGDVATLDEDGFYTIVDRKKDMIVSGGFNVFPREIEDVLSGDPTVASAAVIGVPDAKWGEAVKALVVARPGASIDPEALRERVREAKGPVYAPKSIEVVDSLPLTPVGKPDKKVLRARYWKGRTRSVN